MLNPAEARVLGTLVEKEVTTPDYYPLSLNAIVNACNQRSNREPVLDLDEDDCAPRAAWARRPAAGRPRAWQRKAASPSTNTGWEKPSISAAQRRRCCACCCCAARKHRASCAAVPNACTASKRSATSLGGLQKLMEREPPLAAVLPRQPGTKESRYAQSALRASADGGLECAGSQCRRRNCKPRRADRESGREMAELRPGRLAYRADRRSVRKLIRGPAKTGTA